MTMARPNSSGRSLIVARAAAPVYATAIAAPIDPAVATDSTIVRVIAVQTESNGDLLVTLAVAHADSVAVAQLAATNQLLLVGQSVDGGG